MGRYSSDAFDVPNQNPEAHADLAKVIRDADLEFFEHYSKHKRYCQ